MSNIPIFVDLLNSITGRLSKNIIDDVNSLVVMNNVGLDLETRPSFNGNDSSSDSAANITTYFGDTQLLLNENASIGYNESLQTKEFIFDRTDVRVIFITLYSLVFCCCFFGKQFRFYCYFFQFKHMLFNLHKL